MVAEIICVGTELLLGNIVNTNATYLARICARAGVSVYYQSAVGDNEKRIMEALRCGLIRSDIVILSGGLGPTKDDLTKECAAKVLDLPLVSDEEVRQSIQNYFDQIGRRDIPDNNWKQALVPMGAKVLQNRNGTAPGLIIEKDDKTVILLPGPPSELCPLVEEAVLPYLSSLQSQVYYSTMVKLAGVGESRAETEILDLIDGQSNPTIAPYAKLGEVHLRVTSAAKDIEMAKELSKPLIEELKRRFGTCVYTLCEQENLEDVVVKMLNEKHYTIVTAESCTAGLLSSRLVNVAGASDVFKEGYITYSDEAKMKNLHVKEDTLRTYTAVSKQTAKEMAIGAMSVAGSDVSVAITGLAGPGGGSEEIPVGTVFIGCKCKDNVTVNEYHFNGNRSKVREYAVIAALNLIRTCLLEQEYNEVDS